MTEKPLDQLKEQKTNIQKVADFISKIAEENKIQVTKCEVDGNHITVTFQHSLGYFLNQKN